MSPYKVYERLNDAGKPLSSADLVRNLIFEKVMKTPEIAEQIHIEKMVPFENMFDYKKQDKCQRFAFVCFLLSLAPVMLR